MSATGHEQELAQTRGVRIKHWARPSALVGDKGRVAEAVFEYTRAGADGRAVGTGGSFTLPADMVFKAIGQIMLALPGGDGAGELLETDGGRLAVDGDRRTSLPDVWAGGDCISGGDDLTVSAVQDGKVAAQAIDRALRSQRGGGRDG
jgi:glutamate synthase (NADPH/NADH) small chain